MVMKSPAQGHMTDKRRGWDPKPDCLIQNSRSPLPLTEAVSIYNSGDVTKKLHTSLPVFFSFACFYFDGSVALLTSLWFKTGLLGLSQTGQNRFQMNPNCLCLETNYLFANTVVQIPFSLLEFHPSFH